VNITNVHNKRVCGFHNLLRKIVQMGSYFGGFGNEKLESSKIYKK